MVLVLVHVVVAVKEGVGGLWGLVVVVGVGTSAVVVKNHFHVAEHSNIPNYLLEVRVGQLQPVAVADHYHRWIETANFP